MARELTDEEKKAYDHMLEGAKQLNIFGEEEELDAKVCFYTTFRQHFVKTCIVKIQKSVGFFSHTLVMYN